MTDLFDFNALLQFIKANWAPLFVAAVLMPFVLNAGKGALRRVFNRLSRYPTFAPGAIYADCISPSGGYYPRLSCIRNGFLSVVMQTPSGAVFFIENRDLDSWVLPIIYDPMRPDHAKKDTAGYDRLDSGEPGRGVRVGELSARGKNEDVRHMLSERWRPGRD